MAWSLTNKASNRTTFSTTIALTVPSTTAGRTLVGVFLLFDAAHRSVSTVAGGTGGNWTQYFQTQVVTGPFDGITYGAFYLPNCPAGITTVTLTANASTQFLELAVYELNTGGATPATDGTPVFNHNKAAVGTIYTGEALTTSGGGLGAAFGFYWDVNATQNPRAGNEFADGGEQFSGGSDAVCLLLNPTSAAHTPEWVGGLAGSGGTFTLAFKEAAAATQVPYTTPPAAVLSSWPASLEPRLHPQNTKQNTIAALIYPAPSPFTPGRRTGTIYPAILLTHQDAIPTIELVASGTTAQDGTDQPPRQFALAPQTQRQISARWTPTWDAQSPPKSASWNVPPALVELPHVPPPPTILLAWVPPFVPPPRPVAIAPLTLPTGTPPPPQFALARTTMRQIAATWVQTWPAQRAANNAGWNVPPVLVELPHVALPQALWASWVPPFVAPPRPVSVATLTLVYGTAPPPRAPLAQQTLMDITASWVQTWGAQRGHGFTEGIAPPPSTFKPFWAVISNYGVGGILP